MERFMKNYEICPYKDNSKWYKIRNHFFKRTRARAGSWTLECGDSNCTVTILVKLGAEMPNPAHHHDSTSWILPRNEMFRTLKEEVQRDAEQGLGQSLSQIYERVAFRFLDGAPHLLYENIVSSMRSWRSAVRPALPQTLEQYAQQLSQTALYAGILLGVVSAAGGHAVILVMQGFAECLRQAEAIVVDGTFAVTTTTPPCAQILTIHVIIQNRFFHPVLVMMTSRVRGIYDAVFARIWAAAGGPTPPNILTDYEIALQTSLQAVCPTARIQGCYFHFVQALVKRFRILGIVAAGRRKLLKLYVALATLPPTLMRPAFAEIQSLAAELALPFNQDFHEYFNAFWMIRIGPEKFSVFGAAHRTSNVAESFHAGLGRDIGANPNIWALTGKLTQKLHCSAARYTALRAGNVPARARNNTRPLINMRRAGRELGDLDAGRITVRQYLHAVITLVNLPADAPPLEEDAPPVELADHDYA